MWKKKKMLVTSIFFFSHDIFYPSKTNFSFLVTIFLSAAVAFNLDQSRKLFLDNELTLNQIIAVGKDDFWKQCGYRRKCC